MAFTKYLLPALVAAGTALGTPFPVPLFYRGPKPSATKLEEYDS